MAQEKEEDFVDIFVSAKKGQPIKIYPDPATVVAGENVAWEVYYDGRDESLAEPLSWTIYFSSGSPFENWDKRTVQAEPKLSPEQKGWLDGGAATKPGDYKYSVRLANARTQRVLCDDDPRLIVRPRSS